MRCDWLPVDCTHKSLAGTQGEYIKYTAAVRQGQTSTAFVFAWLEDFSFRHDSLPILFSLALPSDFLEFERREMAVSFVLSGNTSLSTGRRRMGVKYIPWI